MLLAIDVGNTDTTLGLFGDDDLAQTWRVSTVAARTADEHGLLLAGLLDVEGFSLKDVDGVIVASVVPQATDAIRVMVDRYLELEPFVIGPGVKTGVPVKMDNPKEVGADRIVGAAAAAALYGAPAIVVDVGTAITFDAVSAEGEFVGGAIAPGGVTAMNALVRGTAQLRRVEFVPPRTPIGRSTDEAIRSGVVLGYTSLIEGMIDRIRDELEGDVTVVLTGGMAEVMAPMLTDVDHVDPLLVLKGLKIIYDRNERAPA